MPSSRGATSHDQAGAIAPQALRELAANARNNGDPRNARTYTQRAERLERESGQR